MADFLAGDGGGGGAFKAPAFKAPDFDGALAGDGGGGGAFDERATPAGCRR